MTNSHSRIITEHVYPPIPDRSMDWSAIREGYCGCGECNPLIGRGRTEDAAVADLLEQEEEAK
jgi:hypothetical protein